MTKWSAVRSFDTPIANGFALTERSFENKFEGDLFANLDLTTNDRISAARSIDWVPLLIVLSSVGENTVGGPTAHQPHSPYRTLSRLWSGCAMCVTVSK